MSVDDVSPIRPGDKIKISLYGLPESDWLEVEDVDPRHSRVMATLPSGWTRWLYSGDEITAHEPAAPALPDWWGSKVIHAHGLGYYPYDQNEDDYVGVTGIPRRPEFFENVDVTVIVDRDGNLPAAEQALDERDQVRADRDRLQDEYLRHVGMATERADALREQTVDLNAQLEAAVSRAQRADEERRKAEAERNELRARLSAYHSPDAGEAFDAFHAEGIEIARLKAERDAARADLAAFLAEVAKVRDDVRNLYHHQIEQRLSAILDGADQ